MFYDDGDIIERPFPPRVTSSSSTTTIFRNAAFIECTVIKSVPYPDPNNSEDSPKPKPQWFCMEETNDRTMHRLKGDVEAYFDNYIINRNLRLQIPLDSIQVSDKSISIVDLDADNDRSSINVLQGSKRPSRRLLGRDDSYFEYCEDEYFKGTYKVLIVRVEDKHGNSVNQSEDKLYDDFFQDENNLVSFESVAICYCKFVYIQINLCIPFSHLS